MGLLKFYRQCPQYDMNFGENPNWWQRLFKIMDEDAKIPLYLREEVLQDIFPKKIVEQIISILRVPEKKHKNFLLSISSKESHHTESELNTSKLRVNQDRYKFNTDNPYSRFFKKSEASLAIWNPRKIELLEDVSLIEKAKIVTRKVAQDFVNWLREFLEASSGQISIELACHAFEQSFKSKPTSSTRRHSSPEKSGSHGKIEIKNVQHLRKLIEMERRKKAKERQGLSVSDVTKMFGIGCTLDACSSVSISVKECTIIHPPVEDFMKTPPCEYIRKLHKLLKEDKKAAMGDYKLKQNLPIFDRKAELDPYEQEVVLFKRLWHSIKELDSTYGFCKWLIDNPEKEPPRYLLDFYVNETLSKTDSINSQSTSTTLSKVSSRDFIGRKSMMPSFE